MANVLCVSHEWSLGFEELRELSNAGFRVLPVASGYDAIKQFTTREIDAIIVNRRLPDIEVRDLVQYFRSHDESLPIVMLSSVMPVSTVPTSVDAVIHKHSGAALLVPTLEVLLSARCAKHVPGGDDLLSRAA
jgi:DNA-binding response OmpR family regulator